MTEESEKYMRQAALVSLIGLKKAGVTLVGAGGIGSVTAQFLTKMGIKNLEIFDADHVELHNLPNQMFPQSSLGLPKASALALHLGYMDNDVEANAFDRVFTKDDDANEILIMAVDSMESRSQVWEAAKKSKKTKLVIDGRMGGWVCQRLVIRMENQEDVAYYESSFYSDEEAQHLPCTERAVIFNTSAIGSLICDAVAKYVSGREVSRHVAYDMLNNFMHEIRE